MKTLFKSVALFAIIIASVLIAVPLDNANAQLVRVDHGLFYNGAVVNAFQDSSAGWLPIKYNKNVSPFSNSSFEKYPELQGATPESIRVSWNATSTSDSVKMQLLIKTRQANGTVIYAVIDSIKASGFKTVVVSGDQWWEKDEFAVVAKAYTGNCLVCTTAVRLRVDWYFKKKW